MVTKKARPVKWFAAKMFNWFQRSSFSGTSRSFVVILERLRTLNTCVQHPSMTQMR